MNTPILNRDFEHPADGWYQIEAPGEHPNKRAGIIQVIDGEAVTSIVNRFNAEADADPNFPGMLIDHEHFKHDDDKESVAYGWLMRLRNRQGIPEGQVRWTGTGKPAVDSGDYRYFSTEYDQREMKVLNKEVGSGTSAKLTRVRPLRLDGLTLTNSPNNKGQKPITNRVGDIEQFPPGPADVDRPKQIESKKMKTVCTLLGLSADASEEAVHAAVTKIMNRATVAEGQLTIVTNRASTAETKIKEMETAQVEADLATYKGRFQPAQEPFIRSMLVTNRAEAVKFLEAQPAIPGLTAPARVHVLNRAADPNQAAAGAADAESLRIKRQDAVETYKVTNRCTFETATNAVRRRSPELFGLAARAA